MFVLSILQTVSGTSTPIKSYCTFFMFHTIGKVLIKRAITLTCHNMEIKTIIGSRGFLMYKKYRCLYKHISNSIRNICNWFEAFERVVPLQSNL